jgi:hypothetical protein
MVVSTYGAAAEQYVCTYDNKVRKVRLNYPTGHQVPCSVIYEKPTEDGSKKIMWEAQQQIGYCETKASEFTEYLRTNGWNCKKDTATDNNKNRSNQKYLLLHSVAQNYGHVDQYVQIMSPKVNMDTRNMKVKFTANVKKSGCPDVKEIGYEGVIRLNDNGGYSSVLTGDSLHPAQSQLFYIYVNCFGEIANCYGGSAYTEVWYKTEKSGLKLLDVYSMDFLEPSEPDYGPYNTFRGTKRPSDEEAEMLLELDKTSCSLELINEMGYQQLSSDGRVSIYSQQYSVNLYKNEIELLLLKESYSENFHKSDPWTAYYAEIIEGDIDLDGDTDFILPYSVKGRYGIDDYVNYLQVFINNGGSYNKALKDFYETVSKGYYVNFESINNGMLVGKSYEMGPEDAPCCPSVEKDVFYTLVNDNLQEVNKQKSMY